MSNVRYRPAARLIHWIMAALILSMLGLGLAMVDSLAAWRIEALALHKLGGLLVLLLVFVRLGVRWHRKPPPLPDSIAPLQRGVAHVSHALLYGLMLLVPLAGWAMQGAAGIPMRIPGGLVLPQLFAEDLSLYGILRTAHGLLAWSLLGVVLLHIAGALQHAWVLRDGLLRRML